MKNLLCVVAINVTVEDDKVDIDALNDTVDLINAIAPPGDMLPTNGGVVIRNVRWGKVMYE